MTGAEVGFLLLTSHLGNPERKVLTASQLRMLAGRVQMVEKGDPHRELTVEDLLGMGYSREMAARIVNLLSDGSLLEYYCRQGAKNNCFSLSRISSDYPQTLKNRLGQETPGCLWYKGDISLLRQPAVALVGSRDIEQPNRAFAAEVGRQAAKQGFVLVSGNARGADQTAQQSCLRWGGKVISVVADGLLDKPEHRDILYLSEDEFDACFTARRAISRNRVIHALGRLTFVAQCRFEEGGTWDGTAKNLRHGWSKVYCYADGSTAVQMLQQMGAEKIQMDGLSNFEKLPRVDAGLFEDL